MKPRLIFSGPIMTRSGYGDHSRDLLHSLWEMDKYDISILPTTWGHTPLTELKDDSKFSKWVRSNILKGQEITRPDVFVQVSVANEFKPYGKFNIGVTAGVETTLAPKSFIDGCNQMDLIIVPSEFTKKVLETTTYNQQNRQTGKVIKEHKITTPIKVLFEGVDLEVFGQSHGHSVLDEVEEDFNFLFVGHWLNGALGEDRKDVGGMIESFCRTFNQLPSESRPGLILKTSHAGFSVMDRELIWDKIEKVTERFGEKCPSIYLLHGDLSQEELSSLYYDDKVKAMVSFTKGEGYGRPLCEFSMTGKPVMASNWSGHTDFLSEEGAVLLDGELKQVHQSVVNDYIIKESSWFSVDYKKAMGKFFDLFNNYEKYLSKSTVMGKQNKSKFSKDEMSKTFKKLIEKHVKTPEFREFKLPNLKKKEEK